jgi:hypothetical protein
LWASEPHTIVGMQAWRQRLQGRPAERGVPGLLVVAVLLTAFVPSAAAGLRPGPPKDPSVALDIWFKGTWKGTTTFTAPASQQATRKITVEGKWDVPIAVLSSGNRASEVTLGSLYAGLQSIDNGTSPATIDQALPLKSVGGSASAEVTVVDTRPGVSCTAKMVPPKFTPSIIPWNTEWNRLWVQVAGPAAMFTTPIRGGACMTSLPYSYGSGKLDVGPDDAPNKWDKSVSATDGAFRSQWVLFSIDLYKPSASIPVHYTYNHTIGPNGSITTFHWEGTITIRAAS